jgi:hypothetical protein
LSKLHFRLGFDILLQSFEWDYFVFNIIILNIIITYLNVQTGYLNVYYNSITVE